MKQVRPFQMRHNHVENNGPEVRVLVKNPERFAPILSGYGLVSFSLNQRSNDVKDNGIIISDEYTVRVLGLSIDQVCFFPFSSTSIGSAPPSGPEAARRAEGSPLPTGPTCHRPPAQILSALPAPTADIDRQLPESRYCRNFLLTHAPRALLPARRLRLRLRAGQQAVAPC